MVVMFPSGGVMKWYGANVFLLGVMVRWCDAVVRWCFVAAR